MTSLSITLPAPSDAAPAASDTAVADTAVAAPETDDRAVLAEERTLALTITDFVRYQGASGDFNPIQEWLDASRAASSSGVSSAFAFPFFFAFKLSMRGIRARSRR